MWQNDEISFFDVSLAAGRLRHMMRFVALDLFTESAGGGFRHAILVAPAPGETHTLGATLAAEFFRRDHWHVTLEPKCCAADLVRMAGSQHFDVLGLSLTSAPDVKALAETISEVRAASTNPSIFVIIGGDAVARDAGLVDELGADATLAALEFAPSRAHRLVDALFGPDR